MSDNFFFFFALSTAITLSPFDACLQQYSLCAAIFFFLETSRFAFRLCFIRFVLLFLVVLSGEPKTEPRARVGRPQTGSSPPVISLLAVPRRLFCFWFFGDFRCGVLLFMVILVIYKYKYKNR